MMTEPFRNVSFQEPFDDEERELMDPESWDWDSTEELEPVPNPGAVLQVRFEQGEFRALARLAREEGIGPVEFLRRIALDRIAAASRHERAS
jgi:hypothetical protein